MESHGNASNLVLEHRIIFIEGHLEHEAVVTWRALTPSMGCQVPVLHTTVRVLRTVVKKVDLFRLEPKIGTS